MTVPTDAQFELARVVGNAIFDYQLALHARFGNLSGGPRQLALLAGRDVVAAGRAVADYARHVDVAGAAWRLTSLSGSALVHGCPVWTLDAFAPDGWRIVHLAIPGAYDLPVPERLPTNGTP